jgi:hypothetical protein
MDRVLARPSNFTSCLYDCPSFDCPLIFFLFLFVLSFSLHRHRSVARTHARTHARACRLSFSFWQAGFFVKEFSFRATVTTVDRKKLKNWRSSDVAKNMAINQMKKYEINLRIILLTIWLKRWKLNKEIWRFFIKKNYLRRLKSI